VTEDLESIRGAVPGPRTEELRSHLQAYESQNVTYLARDFPVFWESASGATVTDVDRHRYIDLTAAFGVANVGHANKYVVAALHDQATRLMHGMGDVHPTEVRAQLLERLVQILPPGLEKTYLASTGSEAIEAALKTAMLSTAKKRFVAYRGAYHGLSLGALAVCGIPKFRDPFRGLAAETTIFLDYPRNGRVRLDDALKQLRDTLDTHDDIAAVILEPVQGRGGCVIPPRGYLAGVRDACSERSVLLIFDEIYTGFGRTGAWFACEHEGVTPDIICIGKAMGSGFPISAAVARRDVMDAWPRSEGEALHTSTYLGNPMGCAAALATIHELEHRRLPERAKHLGELLASQLPHLGSTGRARDVRGCGLMWGIQVRDAATADRVVKSALARGVILLQSGLAGDVLSITPPLVITERQLTRAIGIVQELL
jgi:4-aminobutyrate aminotransferase-like enzyme